MFEVDASTSRMCASGAIAETMSRSSEISWPSRRRASGSRCRRTRRPCGSSRRRWCRQAGRTARGRRARSALGVRVVIRVDEGHGLAGAAVGRQVVGAQQVRRPVAARCRRVVAQESLGRGGSGAPQRETAELILLGRRAGGLERRRLCGSVGGGRFQFRRRRRRLGRGLQSRDRESECDRSRDPGYRTLISCIRAEYEDHLQFAMRPRGRGMGSPAASASRCTH